MSGRGLPDRPGSTAELGCQVAQGYRYSRARRGTDLVGFLGEHEPVATQPLT
jgi:hypothetical protein